MRGVFVPETGFFFDRDKYQQKDMLISYDASIEGAFLAVMIALTCQTIKQNRPHFRRG